MSTGTADSARGEFASLLRGLRGRAGLSQEELAHRAGLSVRAVADMERGRTRGPQRRTVAALVAALAPGEAGAEALERAAAGGRPRPRATPAAPAGLRLPRDVGDFTARDADLARLRALAVDPGTGDPPVVLVTGQPGLGKTAFAVRAAHGLAERYPDGQLAVDLHGTRTPPADPREVLLVLLRACGIAENTVPQDTEGRADLFRTVAAERRMLLLLDDAADEDQLRPLLPAAGPVLTLVTSRNALTGLEGAHRFSLGVLRREESVALFSRVIGPERVAAEAQAARDLADLCGQLPLAVRIAAQRLAARPQERLARLAAQLADEGRRLDALRAGDLQVRATFALSYGLLDPLARRVLRRATLAAGPDFSPQTAALLAGTTLREAERCAEELADRGLLQPDPAAERYRFHDLLRLFAAEQLAEDDPAGLARAQETTALWTLARATAAALHFDPERSPAGDPDRATAPHGTEEARSWLEEERAQWLDALGRALADGHHREVLDTAEAMHWFSDRAQEWEQWARVFLDSVAAARALGSRRDEAVHLNYLAWAYNLCVRDPASGLATARAALAVAREVGDLLQEGWAHGYGAGALQRLGRHEEAETWLEESADCHRRNPAPQARLAELSTLNALGAHLRSMGRAGEALDLHRRSEALCRVGIPGQSAELLALYRDNTFHHLARDLGGLERWAEAEPLLRRALVGFETAGMAAWSEPVRLDLAITLRRLGRSAEARAMLEAARRGLAEQSHPRQAEAELELMEAIRSGS
ncbi:helix-turn-helix domain-containing protein [Streptomyces sp. SID8352]|uniref:ATP-binding protein n=1 Tax=Streptomyces sp. SID8352 TaxID=2690338 RepID=UPI00136D1D39|nr:helix-turn-helix domain-containing protein [Streptomyces sp. SID8352]MYU23082.1 tetratricopeptide repeat protein [Streptomyces sp. SID8352]